MDSAGRVLTSRALTRDKFIAWCAQLPPACAVAMETSSSAHHWSRKLIATMGLNARIIAAQLISPYRKQGASGKNDANDAAAICEAASRPHMHFVPVKSIEQQSMLCVHRLRDGYKADRVACINRIRGLLGEYSPDHESRRHLFAQPADPRREVSGDECAQTKRPDLGVGHRTQRAFGMAESRRGIGQQERTHLVGGDDQGRCV